MRLFIQSLIITATALMLAACGSDNTLSGGGGTDPTDPTVTAVSAITLQASNQSIPSDGTQPVTITAIAQDANNVVIPDVVVTFSATSGGLQVTQPVTDVTGSAVATINTGGNAENRIITLTATSGSATANISVNVTGTSLSVNGPSSLTIGDTGTFTFVLADAGDNGIRDQALTLTSALGNTFAATSLTTDVNGQAQVQYTATTGGQDTILASALGNSITTEVTVSGDSFAFTTPALNGEELVLNINHPLTVNWRSNNAPVVGRDITFNAPRGLFFDGLGLSATFVATTDASGNATALINSSEAGISNIQARGDQNPITLEAGPTTSRQVEFVATVPDTIEVQAETNTLGENESTTITAVVRDAAGNLVKNTPVNFSLQDVTGGSVSVASALTNSGGAATTVYTASNVTSANDAVVITATVEGTAISNAVNLTVSRRQVFVRFGFDNVLAEVPPNYQMQFSVTATDSDGVALPNVDIQVGVLSERYSKGVWFIPLDDMGEPGDEWATAVSDICVDEDVNRNGILDAGEDINGNGTIEAGGVASISPGTVTTDANGIGSFTLSYPQTYGAWLEVEVFARSGVEGTEFENRLGFNLNVVDGDVDANNAPPGLLTTIDSPYPMTTVTGQSFTLAGAWITSPFGYGDTCAEAF